MNLIILGPQGSGKGTQARLLAKKFKLQHFSVGQLLRREVKKNTPDGKIINRLISRGNLAPTPLIMKILMPKITKSNGYIFDGFPRSLEQTKYFAKLLQKNKSSIDKVIYITLSEKSSYARLLKRAKIEERSDDTKQSIKKRLGIYHQQTKPVIDYYRKQGKVIEVNGEPDIQTIHRNILSKIKNHTSKV